MVKNATPHNTKGDVFTSFNVEDFDVPKGRDEIWRFVSLRALRGLHNGSFAQPTDPDITVTVGGKEVSPESGVSVERIAKDDARATYAGAPADRVAAQAWTSMTDVTLVTVAKDTKIDDAIYVTTTGHGIEAPTFAGVVIAVEPHAEATVVLSYQGHATHADNIHFRIGDGARLTVVVDADWENDSVHLSQHQAVVGRDARLHHSVATFGGEVVRIVPRVRFEAQGGEVELLGVYFADDGQYFENRLLVDHSEPNCTSNVLYKGALQGNPDTRTEARTCWVGDVLIRAAATNTNTYEANRNLVLSQGARADAIPNLEIETGDIPGAGHAATVGRFDDMHVFYLMSRGIPEAEARRLIVHGFFTEVIRQIPVQSVREELERRVEKELENVVV
ncbi:Fe-S cluster assembly protein SufD [Corynebacterium uberis]|uniref:Fe-S cluster assembly protein SufD n=1 Tax=Corynebacterium TaxID=1716 RepID=UPI001D0B3FC0|nr:MULTISPECIES: Fe-S cluster assembly protein SufD [Corynebacterium]MCZ9308615.1 Fe-S cluster assembly protein SufD [Corynebacterium sp. c6VSa_13]UDL74707.1 Fe-S cluster assembly protein SufD [Corynebacterium uberis]UDL76947.1 Fe-S cluster assembly protein SufD [Corynebacterium uberis]UDL79158.1 Fe-S cluster assembly protein SufD [Corynebacterium uberis]UDL81363.1 Fe-S cluster assembly protein SufD [Corynebacterium uberis]